MTKTKVILITVVVCVLSTMAISGFVRNHRENKNNNEANDSLFIVYTVKEYSKRDWYWFHNYSRMYKITNDDILCFVEKIFYSPDERKLIAWVGHKMYNASTIDKYSDDEKSNRICPLAGDTVYHMGVVIGYKNSDNDLWKLYPWGNRQVPCCNSISSGLNDLEEYYFKEIKKDYLETIGQKGKSKGLIEKSLYKYAINDKDFWSKSPVWQKDTIGAYNLYPFEVKSYGYGLVDTCLKCAEKIQLPQVSYPDSILQ